MLILRAGDRSQGQPLQQSQGRVFRDVAALKEVLSANFKSEWNFRWLGRA